MDESHGRPGGRGLIRFVEEGGREVDEGIAGGVRGVPPAGRGWSHDGCRWFDFQ